MRWDWIKCILSLTGNVCFAFNVCFSHRFVCRFFLESVGEELPDWWSLCSVVRSSVSVLGIDAVQEEKLRYKFKYPIIDRYKYTHTYNENTIHTTFIIYNCPVWWKWSEKWTEGGEEAVTEGVGQQRGLWVCETWRVCGCQWCFRSSLFSSVIPRYLKLSTCSTHLTGCR